MTEYVYPKPCKAGWKYPHPLRIISLMLWDLLRICLVLGIMGGFLYAGFRYPNALEYMVAGLVVVVCLVLSSVWACSKLSDWYDNARGRLMCMKKRG